MASDENETGRKPRRKVNNLTPASSLFTFIISNGQNGDILAKKIRDPKDRHIIRSKVMRTVRAKEAEEGRKRKSGRKPPQEDKKASKATPKASKVDSGSQAQMPTGDFSTSPPQWGSANDSSAPHSLYRSPGIQWIDPFETLYSGNGISATVKFLVNYSCHVFIPMTYPIETKSPSQLRSRCGYLIQKANMSASFLAYLAIAAGHRAVAEKRHKDLAPSNESGHHSLYDPEYYILLGEAYAVINRKHCRGEFDDGDVFEAHFALAGAAAMAGNFVEARKQIQLSREFRIRTGFDPDGPGGIPPHFAAADSKCALGLLEAPLYPLPWEPEPIEDTVIARLVAVPGSPMSRLGQRFGEVAELNPSFLGLLRDLQILCYFIEFDGISEFPLTTEEHLLFSQKSQELEHSLLKYPLHKIPGVVKRNNIVLDSLVTVVRIAALSLLSRIGVVAQPSTGVGRSLTWNTASALRAWMDTDSCKYASTAALELVIWVLFLSIDGATDQPEVPFFQDLMGEMAGHRGWTEWEDVAEAMFGFLYMPSFHEKRWRLIWDMVRHRIGVSQLHFEGNSGQFGVIPR